MKSVQEMNFFDDDYSNRKKESINLLLQDHNIVEVLQQFNLTRQDIEENWIEFLDYKEDHDICLACKSLASCPKVSKGMVRSFNYQNGEVKLSLMPCRYGQNHFTNQRILNSILLKNVSEKLLLTKPSDLTFKNDASSNGQAIIMMMSEYIINPTNKGFYLYGQGGTGKSTIMGFLIRCLVMKGFKCGYIHFPTFLMDLKSSFGNEELNNSLELMKNLDYLVIDDLGGENVTTWSRDEVLSAVLAYRLQNEKVTFFTSEYSFEKLKKLYMLKASDSERVSRLISRIKAVSIPLELKGKDLR